MARQANHLIRPTVRIIPSFSAARQKKQHIQRDNLKRFASTGRIPDASPGGRPMRP
jgi:hypothetical protein